MIGAEVVADEGAVTGVGFTRSASFWIVIISLQLIRSEQRAIEMAKMPKRMVNEVFIYKLLRYILITL